MAQRLSVKRSFFFLLYPVFFGIAHVQDAHAFFASLPKKAPMAFDLGTLRGRMQLKFKPESFYLKNAHLLNSRNPSDKIFLSRSTLDVSFNLGYPSPCGDHLASEFFMTIRNKNTWGNTESIAQTSATPLKLLEASLGEHKHFMTRHILWIRELWFSFCINDALSLPFEQKHYFTMGAFPFELGRGIALGSAFAVGPRILGFFSDNAVDQYAFGYKFSGSLTQERKLSYDIYGAILENKGDSFLRTAANIRGQEYGRKRRQQRGPGSVDFVIAGRMKWEPKKEGTDYVGFEPYMLFNSAPEQKIEFLGDATSKLGTFGLAGEFTHRRFECGFDTAVNVGRQIVRGWDRNIVRFVNRSGVPTLVNSDVLVAPQGQRAIYDPVSPAGAANQKIINDTAQSASQNGQQIGANLFNSNTRFRDPMRVSYKGWMVIGDAAYWLNSERTVKLAAMAGCASGDESPYQNFTDPNAAKVDGDFKGFIGLQELYSGNPTRVQSVFLLGGVGRAPRPLSAPIATQVVDPLPATTSGFNNLAFVGGAFHWYPTHCGRKFTVRPNILAYWQERSTRKFDFETKRSSTEFARDYLGLELNAFLAAELMPECKLYAVGSVFIPGSHYRDIKGTPLTPDQLRALDRRDKTGVIFDQRPLLSNDVAFTMNFGIECRF